MEACCLQCILYFYTSFQFLSMPFRTVVLLAGIVIHTAGQRVMARGLQCGLAAVSCPIHDLHSRDLYPRDLYLLGSRKIVPMFLSLGKGDKSRKLRYLL